jgi:hypothetical protein
MCDEARSRDGIISKPISFGDCNGEGLGAFHLGEEDLTAWDRSPRWSPVGSLIHNCFCELRVLIYVL